MLLLLQVKFDRKVQAELTAPAIQCLSVQRHRGAVGAGVEAVDILMSKDFPGQNRGFAFVEFYNHACALAAKNALSAPGYT